MVRWRKVHIEKSFQCQLTVSLWLIVALLSKRNKTERECKSICRRRSRVVFAFCSFCYCFQKQHWKAVFTHNTWKYQQYTALLSIHRLSNCKRVLIASALENTSIDSCVIFFCVLSILLEFIANWHILPLHMYVFVCISEWIHEYMQLKRTTYLHMHGRNKRKDAFDYYSHTHTLTRTRAPAAQICNLHRVRVCVCAYAYLHFATPIDHRMSMGITDRKCENAWIIEHLSCWAELSRATHHYGQLTDWLPAQLLLLLPLLLLLNFPV